MLTQAPIQDHSLWERPRKHNAKVAATHALDGFNQTLAIRHGFGVVFLVVRSNATDDGT
jgi:hypothetical protein